MTDGPRGMLVAVPDRWDESCFAMPAVRALVASGIGVGVICSAQQSALWATLEGLEVVDFQKGESAKIVAGKILGGWQASLAWDDGIAAQAFQAAGISRRLGVAHGLLKKRLTHPLDAAVGPLEHRVRFYLAAVEALGVETSRPEFFAPISAEGDFDSQTRVLCPDSDFGASYEWPLARWVEIGERLVETGANVKVIYLEGGRGLGKKLCEHLGTRVEPLQVEPLSSALPVLALQGLIVAADGSVPHLASHAGATCVVLFGPNDPVWKRPLGKRHVVVRQHVECAPCLLPKCPLDLRCQNEMAVERVWQAILSKWL